MSFWSEIKQRRITQIVVTYLAGGWIVTSAVDQVVDREILPPVVYQVTLALYLFGILAALIIGWYHGEKGAQKATTLEIAMLAVVGLLAVGSSVRVVQNSMAEAQLADAIDTDDLRRIAVLYLEDGSRGGTLQPLADGITEGVIASLSTINELDVRTRNASRRARELGDVSIDSIARALEVGAVIDGSVDETGDELRISVRVLEGTTGGALFRETFSWPSTDVANVGTELATEIATQLREQLGGEIRVREAEAEAPNQAAWLQMARAERFLGEAEAAVRAGDFDGFVSAMESADAEAIAAAESAPEWTDPIVMRSRVAYEWHVATPVDEIADVMDESIDFANQALQLDPNDPDALERRGTALYRKWLVLGNLQTDPVAHEAMLAEAQADLERTQTLDPDRASVKNTLSHLYYQIGDLNGAALTAREAYEQDAFLASADDVLWRIFNTNFDLGQGGPADQWCAQGFERFPENERYTRCQIIVMTMPGGTPDIDRAWELHEDLGPLLVDQPELLDAQARMFVGGVIGLSGNLEQADEVMREARQAEDVDPTRELLFVEAMMRSVIGDTDAALDLMEQYALAIPEAEFYDDWYWRNVASDPRFDRLRARN